MKLKTILLFITLFLVLTGCGVPKEDYDKLKIELDECKFGAEKLIAKIEKEYSEKDYSSAKTHIIELYEKHPESPKNIEYKKILKTIEKEELLEQKRIDAEEKEMIRIANLNYTGMWRISYYVDKFGELTDRAYITNTELISGTFSNSVTQNSDLNVIFLISNSANISFQLYEYGGSNPKKAKERILYKILVLDRDGNEYVLYADNYSDRFNFSEICSRELHAVLMKGGTIKFNISDANYWDNPFIEYKFIIPKADFYENAFRKLKDS